VKELHTESNQKKLPRVVAQQFLALTKMKWAGCTAGKTVGTAASGHLSGLRYIGATKEGKTFTIGSCQNAAWRTDARPGAEGRKPAACFPEQSGRARLVGASEAQAKPLTLSISAPV